MTDQPDLEEIRDDLIESIDQAIEYAEMHGQDDKAKDIIEGARHIKAVLVDDECTLPFVNYSAWVMAIGTFLGLIEAHSPAVIAIVRAEEDEPEDEKVH